KAVAGLARVRLMTLPNDSRAALTVLDRVIDLLAGTCDELTLACAHAYKANVEAVRNNIAGDIVHLERALRITARVPYPRLNAQIESSMGWAYCQMNDIRKGQEHFLAALSGPLSAKDRYWCLTSLVEVEARMGDLEAALEHIGQIEALVDSVCLNPALLVLAYADVKMKQGDHAGAIEMLHSALERYRVGRSRAFQAWTLSQLSLAHRTVGLHAEAIRYALEGLRFSKQHKLPKEIQDNEEQLYQAYASSGNKAAAFVHLRNFISLRDSSNGAVASGIMHSTILRAEMERQARTDSLLRAERDHRKAEQHRAEVERGRTQRNIFLGASLALFVFAATVFRQRDRIKKERDRSDMLLLNILPEEIAAELKEKGASDARQIEQVTVLFTDFKG